MRVTNNSIITTGSNTDGCDPDSSWNVYIGGNTFSTGDDCIAIKAGRDWSGRLVNISTQNVLAEQNYFEKGHGVSIGSETSGCALSLVIRCTCRLFALFLFSMCTVSSSLIAGPLSAIRGAKHHHP